MSNPGTVGKVKRWIYKDWNWVIILVAVVVVGWALWFYWGRVKSAYGWAKDKITKAIPKAEGAGTTKGTTGSSGVAPSTGQKTKFPVTVNSSNQDVITAFYDSGYTAALQTSIDQGIYPEYYLTQMNQKPQEWLARHPILYERYPSYFKSVS